MFPPVNILPLSTIESDLLHKSLQQTLTGKHGQLLSVKLIVSTWQHVIIETRPGIVTRCLLSLLSYHQSDDSAWTLLAPLCLIVCFFKRYSRIFHLLICKLLYNKTYLQSGMFGVETPKGTPNYNGYAVYLHWAAWTLPCLVIELQLRSMFSRVSLSCCQRLRCSFLNANCFIFFSHYVLIFCLAVYLNMMIWLHICRVAPPYDKPVHSSSQP